MVIGRRVRWNANRASKIEPDHESAGGSASSLNTATAWPSIGKDRISPTKPSNSYFSSHERKAECARLTAKLIRDLPAGASPSRPRLRPWSRRRPSLARRGRTSGLSLSTRRPAARHRRGPGPDSRTRAGHRTGKLPDRKHSRHPPHRQGQNGSRPAIPAGLQFAAGRPDGCHRIVDRRRAMGPGRSGQRDWLCRTRRTTDRHRACIRAGCRPGRRSGRSLRVGDVADFPDRDQVRFCTGEPDRAGESIELPERCCPTALT